jgi:hypothetical protein
MPKLRITAQATCCALHYLLRRYKGVLGTKTVLNPVGKTIAVFFSLVRTSLCLNGKTSR